MLSLFPMKFLSEIPRFTLFFLISTLSVGLCVPKILFAFDEQVSGPMSEYQNLMTAAEGHGAFKVEKYKILENSLPKKKLFSGSGEDDPVEYQSVYLFSSQLPKEWTTKNVVDYVEKGGNLFISTDSNVKHSMKSLFNQFGLDLLISDYSISNGKLQWASQHALSNLFKQPNVEENVNGATAFKLLNDARSESNFNPLIQSALQMAPGTAICSSDTSKTCYSSTQSFSVMATLETRKKSRFAALGHSRLLTKLSAKEASGLAGWVQNTKFVLRVGSLSHELIDGSGNRGISELGSTIYRIRDYIKVRLCLEEANEKEGQIIVSRFTPENITPFQYELKMMNVQVRRSFESVDEDGCLVGSVQIPDKSAIYTLQLACNRPGWSQLQINQRLLARPFKHNENERFVGVAFPYYISWIGVMIASYFVLLPSLFRNLQKLNK